MQWTGRKRVLSPQSKIKDSADLVGLFLLQERWKERGKLQLASLFRYPSSNLLIVLALKGTKVAMEV